MGQRVINDKKELDASAASIVKIIKSLEECETQLKSVIRDLEESWKDSIFESDKKELISAQRSLESKKEEIKQKLSSLKIISGMIQNYLSK